MSTSFKVAHIREQGQDMIIFPLNSSFGANPSGEQGRILESLEFAANDAGLKGRAVAIWQQGNQTRFLGPAPWRAFLQSVSYQAVLASVNKKLTIDRDSLAGAC